MVGDDARAGFGAALKGMFGGGVLLLIALVLQFWNEGRTFERDATLGAARADVRAVDAAAPSAANDGALVHVVGEASAAGAVVDEEFGVDLPALGLRRRVEMYQWREKRGKRRENGRKVDDYRYEQRWDDRAIDSTRFAQAQEHANPASMPYDDRTVVADEVRVGGFALAPTIARRLGGWRTVPPSEIALPPNLAASFRADGDWFVTSADARKPQVGDLRVRFERLPPGRVSVVARQEQGRLLPHHDARGGELLLVERGEVDAQSLFAAAGSRNNRLGWILRGAGFGLAWIGFSLLLKPLAVLFGALPLVGRVAGIGNAVVSAVLAALFSAMAIGSGWLWQRPWALVLLLLAVAAFGAWIWRARRAPPLPPSAPIAVPPPPPPPAA